MARELTDDEHFDTDIGRAMKSAVSRVDKRFLARASRKQDVAGSTALAVVLVDRLMAVAHVGDCRLFVHRNGRLFQLTKVGCLFFWHFSVFSDFIRATFDSHTLFCRIICQPVKLKDDASDGTVALSSINACKAGWRCPVPLAICPTK